MQDLGMWVWATEEMVDLVTWIRAHNANPAQARKVRFFGFDMQDGAAAMARLSDNLTAVDPLGHAHVAALQAPYAPFAGIRNLGRRPHHLAPPEVRAQCSQNLQAVRQWMVEQRDAYVIAGGTQAYEWALRMAELLIQHEAYFSMNEFPHPLMAINLRVRYMAHDVDWCLRHLAPGARTVLWAHNGHINKQGAVSGVWTHTGEWLA